MATKTKEKGLSGYEKAAILLLYLGEEVTSHVFSKLGEGEIRRISNIMAGSNIIPVEVRDAVLEEFYDKTKEIGVTSDGDEIIKNALYKAVGKEKGDEILREITMQSGVLADVNRLHPKALSDLIRNEHPQTIALILAHLEPIRSAEVISYFPDRLKKDVVIRIAKMDNVSPETIDEMSQILSRELKAMGRMYGEKLGGTQTVAEILNMMDRSSEELILEGMEEEDPDLTNAIKDLMFVFEDLNNVDDRGIQTILKEVSNDQLLLALKTASDELKEKIFKNMSQRAAEMLKEDMEAMGPVRLSDVENAQQQIVNIARKLEEQGKIVIGGKGGEDLIV